MNKKTRITTIIFLLMILLTVSQSANAINTIKTKEQNATIIVDKTGNSDFTTIQEAIDHASENSEILVKKGIYNEVIQIKKTITLVGEDRESTLIKPISEKNKYAILVGAPETTIKDVTITNGAPGLYTSAIRIITDKNNIISCNIEDTPIGISIWTSENNIENCKFQGCNDEGIALIGAQIDQCRKNIIKNCIFTECCDGIELQKSSENEITQCNFYKNTHSAIDAISSSNDNNIISKCVIKENYAFGIYISSSKENKIIDCEIENNLGNDIKITGNSNNNIITNTQKQNPENEIINKLQIIFKNLQNPALQKTINNINNF